MPQNSFTKLAAVLIFLAFLRTPTLQIFSQVRLSDPGSVPTWMRTFGGYERDWANAIAVVPGGGFIMAGITGSRSAGQADAWIVHFDRAGNLLWQRTYGGSLWDTAMAIAPDPHASIFCGALPHPGN